MSRRAEKHNKAIRACDMELGDEVQYPPFGVWSVGIVKQITAQEVVLYRPYGTTSDFSYTGGVICYVGIEEYKIPRDSSMHYTLVGSRDLK